jgi:tRNA-specific 2-thiouridylase
VGRVDAVELVTVGQRRGLGPLSGDPRRRYVSAIEGDTVRVSDVAPTVSGIALGRTAWVDQPAAPGTPVLAQCSAHGSPVAATWDGERVQFAKPQRLVAPGQSVVLYDGDDVLGGGLALPA